MPTTEELHNISLVDFCRKFLPEEYEGLQRWQMYILEQVDKGGKLDLCLHRANKHVLQRASMRKLFQKFVEERDKLLCQPPNNS